MFRRSILLLPALLALAATGSARADLIEVTLTRGHGSGPGGEFNATPSNGFATLPTGLTGNGYFETFCIEKNEHITLGRTYYGVLSTFADTGSGGPNPDPLDGRTAYLYTQFIHGDLAGYNYGTGQARKASADALQDVIWYLEDEQGWNQNWTQGTLQYQFLTDAQQNATADIGSVRVMQLWGNRGLTEHAQDQLVFVPVPGAAVLGALGAGLVALMRRRYA